MNLKHIKAYMALQMNISYYIPLQVDKYIYVI